MSKISYIGFGSETLKNRPRLQIGDMLLCFRCGGKHLVKGGKDAASNITNLVMFYECGKSLYLAGVEGKAVEGIKPDVKGKV